MLQAVEGLAGAALSGGGPTRLLPGVRQLFPAAGQALPDRFQLDFESPDRLLGLLLRRRSGLGGPVSVGQLPLCRRQRLAAAFPLGPGPRRGQRGHAAHAPAARVLLARVPLARVPLARHQLAGTAAAGILASRA